MIKRILVGIGALPYTRAEIECAIELAERHQAHIAGLSIIDVERLSRVGPVPIGGGRAADELQEYRLKEVQERADQAVTEFEKIAGGVGIPFSVERVTGNPFVKLRELWRYCDLTILGLNPLFDQEVIPGHKDELYDLIVQGVRPILGVPRTYRPCRKALVAYNGSFESAKAMKRFVQMRLWPEAPLRLICFRRGIDAPEKLLQDAAEYCRAHGYQVEMEVLPGSPREKLLEQAGCCEADIIVMGNSTRSALTRRVFGDTLIYAVENSDRTLFVSC